MLCVTGMPGKGASWFTLWACMKLVEDFPQKEVVLVDINKEYCGFPQIQESSDRITVLTSSPDEENLDQQAQKHPTRFYVVENYNFTTNKDLIFEDIARLLDWIKRRGNQPHLVINTNDTRAGIWHLENFGQIISAEADIPISASITPFGPDVLCGD